MTKAALEKAVQTATDNAQKPNIGWGALEALGGLVCVANLPAGLLMGLSGAVGGAVAEKREQKSVAMPDEWLDQVARTPDVSKQGVAHLARCLAQQGFVSVADAVRWLELERQEQENQKRLKAVEQGQRAPGAKALLLRAQAQCGTLLDPSLTDKALGAAQALSQWTPDALTRAARAVLKK